MASPSRKPLADANRNSELAAIHIALHDLKMADADYRLLLNERYGVLSSSALKPEERGDLLKEFEARGWKGRKVSAGRRLGRKRLSRVSTSGAAPDRQGMLRKIDALLLDARPQRDRAYADALARRMCKVDRLEFCTPEQLRKIVAALSIDQKRKGGPNGR